MTTGLATLFAATIGTTAGIRLAALSVGTRLAAATTAAASVATTTTAAARTAAAAIALLLVRAFFFRLRQVKRRAGWRIKPWDRLAGQLFNVTQVGALIIADERDGYTGLASAQLFDPNAGQQGAITGAFLSTIGITVLFTTNMHHLMILALADSYQMFAPGAAIPVGDFSEMASRIVAKSFLIGFQIALPIVVIGTIIYVAMGLMSRLMPQIQVFFIALPVQIVVGFSIFAITLGAGMMIFLDAFQSAIGGFLVSP